MKTLLNKISIAFDKFVNKVGFAINGGHSICDHTTKW